MYQTLLTSRYLTSRVIPIIAVAAVALCVALVIVVVSVMTGFLNMVQSAGRTLMGDVIVTYGISGIPHYETLIDDLEKDPQIVAVTPIVDGWGLLRMPYPEQDAKKSETVQVWGIEPESFSKVTNYDDSLQWESPSANQRDWLLVDAIKSHSEEILDTFQEPLRTTFIDTFNDAARTLHYKPVDLWGTLQSMVSPEQWEAIIELDERLTSKDALHTQGITLSRDGRDAIVSGLHVSDGNERKQDGSYQVVRNDFWWLPRYEGTLTMLPVDARGGMIEPESIVMPFANEFASGVFMIDESRIFVPLHVAQRLLHVDEAEIIDEDDPTRVLGVDPARVTSILIRSKEGVDVDQLRNRVSKIYDNFVGAFPDSTLVKPPMSSDPGLTIHTWEEQQRSFTGPVEKERELMRTLFSIVYLVVAALILSIFWSIVYEKTRDIGILRSIGASRVGVVWIFLQYSLVIGIAGAALGLLIGWLITSNINAIHTSLGNPPLAAAITSGTLAMIIVCWMIVAGRKGAFLPIVVGLIGSGTFFGITALILYIRSIGGLVIWDASVYYFSIIPNSVDWESAAITCAGAVLFCLLGAAIPAAKAADTDPVKALRHE